jgi:phage terminase large subunit
VDRRGRAGHEEAWVKLIPTLREEDRALGDVEPGEREGADQQALSHEDRRPPRTKIVEMNWRDNPWFPDILDGKRLKDKRSAPTATTTSGRARFMDVVEGAYYAKQLTKAREEGRIGLRRGRSEPDRSSLC